MIWAAVYAVAAAVALAFAWALCRAAEQADRQAERQPRSLPGNPRRTAAPGQCIHVFDITDNECLLCTGWSRQCPRFEEEPHERQ